MCSDLFFLKSLFSIVALCDQDSFKLKLFKNLTEILVTPSLVNVFAQEGYGANELYAGLGAISVFTVASRTPIFRMRSEPSENDNV